MKTEGLCKTCDNNLHCVLTKGNGVLECEEFLASGCLGRRKIATKKKELCICASANEEELRD